MDFPDQLAALRHDRGLTQAALAERADLNVSQLRRYENGTSEPTLAALRRLAIALSVSSDLLVFGEEGRLPEDQKLRLAFEASRFLDKRERETVTALLEAFLARHDNRDGHEGPRARRARPTEASKSTRRR
jgi:transcriptional regulator with XRE-family HTH domain